MKVLFACCILLVFLATANAVCVDRRPDCNNMKAYCKWDAYKDYMKQWCSKTCDLCGTTFPTNVPPTLPTRPTLPTTAGPHVTHPPIGSCGKQVIPNARVISGITAKPGSWPWQILMLHNGRAGCGGTIISPTWIVTAAHCVSGKERNPTAFKIRVGEHNRNRKEGNEVDMPVKRVISHPSWNRRQLNNDIALIQLSSPIQFNNYVQPACIPNRAVDPGTECYITGWGKTMHPGSMTSTLQQVALPVVSNTVCERLNRQIIKVPITSAMICAGHGGANRKSGCHGDSGGPFVCKVGGRWEVHGAVSHGSPLCKASDTYTVFARVAHFRSWISGKMALYGI